MTWRRRPTASTVLVTALAGSTMAVPVGAAVVEDEED
jgi:hypothetical protein